MKYFTIALLIFVLFFSGCAHSGKETALAVQNQKKQDSLKYDSLQTRMKIIVNRLRTDSLRIEAIIKGKIEAGTPAPAK